MNSMARRMFELVEPIGVIPYSADEPNEAMFALGFTNYWDTYFAGRAAPLGLATAEVVDALFYNFAPGEVARHIPKVWRTTTPEAAIAARQAGCVKALRRTLGDHVDSPGFARAAELLTKAATSAPFEGRPMYAALRSIPIPEDVVARLFHAASLLREHRGDVAKEYGPGDAFTAADHAEGTGRDAVAAAVADVRLHHNGVELRVEDGAGRTDVQAGGLLAVLADVGVHQPDEAAVRPLPLDEGDVTPVVGVQLSGVVVGGVQEADVLDLHGNVVPLLAGHLAGLAADADAAVGEEPDLVARSRLDQLLIRVGRRS